MTGALLRVPHAPETSPPSWFTIAGPPYAVLGTDMIQSAVYHNGVTYIGVVDADGAIRAVSYNHSTGAKVVSPTIVTGVGNDVHVSPSILVRSSDNKLLLATCPHDSGAHMYVAVSTNAEDVSSWGASTDIGATLAGTSYTYPKLVQLSGESGKVYLYYRDVVTGTARLCYSTSTDGGATWVAQTELYENTGKQSYWAINSDDASRIDFAVSDGNANSGDTASCYHFYKSGSSYFKTDGTTISTALPLGPSSLTKIYDGATNGSVRVPYSIVSGPIVALAAYDPLGSGQPEKYWYCTQNAGTWTASEIDTTGSTPTSGFSEGGVMIDRIDSTKVYVSRASSGYWQMFLYSTNNGGSLWTNTQLTSDTGTASDVYNLRAVTPKNATSVLKAIWCFGPHWASGGGGEPAPDQLRGYPNPVTTP